MSRTKPAEILYERIIRFKVGYYTVRVWMPELAMPAKFPIMDLALDCEGDARAIAKHLIETFPINAVEVTDPSGAGSVLYADWP